MCIIYMAKSQSEKQDILKVSLLSLSRHPLLSFPLPGKFTVQVNFFWF